MSDFETRWRALVSGEQRAWWSGPARGALWALSLLYEAGVRGNRLAYDSGLVHPETLSRPVVSVGNLTVGGTGKTTAVRWLAWRLLAEGFRPAILSHGYRADSSVPREAVTVVSDGSAVLADVAASGDEPQLLARSLPGAVVLTGRKRVLTARHAVEALGADVCLIDDGFQYWRLRKDLEIVMVNANNPFGFGHLLPWGMLREPLAALRRADAIVITHADRLAPDARSALRRRLEALHPSAVLAETRHEVSALRDAETGEAVPLEALGEGCWLAVSSLGQPESFEQTLEALGTRFVPVRFRDHHRYTEAEVRALAHRSVEEGLAGIVTTEKDSVKMGRGWTAGARSLVLEVELRFSSGQDAIEALLRQRIGVRDHPARN